jgi:hypothetical protein
MLSNLSTLILEGISDHNHAQDLKWLVYLHFVIYYQ